jgi:septum formation protein
MNSVGDGSIKLILASASPRRKLLMSAVGLTFEVVESGIDEVRRDGESAIGFATRMACEKALNVSARMRNAVGKSSASLAMPPTPTPCCTPFPETPIRS